MHGKKAASYKLNSNSQKAFFHHILQHKLPRPQQQTLTYSSNQNCSTKNIGAKVGKRCKTENIEEEEDYNHAKISSISFTLLDHIRSWLSPISPRTCQIKVWALVSSFLSLSQALMGHCYQSKSWGNGRREGPNQHRTILNALKLNEKRAHSA